MRAHNPGGLGTLQDMPPPCGQGHTSGLVASSNPTATRRLAHPQPRTPSHRTPLQGGVHQGGHHARGGDTSPAATPHHARGGPDQTGHTDPPETVRKLPDLMRSYAKANMQTPAEPPLRDPGQQATHPLFKPHAHPPPLRPVPPKRARQKRGAPAPNQAGKAATSRPPAPHPTNPANPDQASWSSSLPSLPPPHPDQAYSSSSLPPPAPPPPEAYRGFEKGAKVQQPFRKDHTGDWIWCEGTIQYHLRDLGDNGGPQILVVWHRQKELDQGSSAPDKPEGHTLELTSAHPIRLRTKENKAHRGTKYTQELPPEWSQAIPPPRLPKRPPTSKRSPSPSPPP